jgi:putative nucleotidyltransferase with HDIG domain
MQTTLTAKQHLNGHALKKRLFRGMDRLLTMPQVVLKAQKLLIDPNSSFHNLSDIIETDQEITLSILKIANSAYYMVKKEVYSVKQACVLLGISVIGEIIMAAGTSTLFSKALEAYHMKPKDLWQHSLTTALGSRKIANIVNPALANEAFLAGLFHDVGKLILDEHIFSRNEAFKRLLGNSPNNHFKAEKEILGFGHSEVASVFCKKWTFPKTVTRAIRHHHHLNPNPYDELACILYAANNLARISANGNGTGDIRQQIDEGVLKSLALKENTLISIKSEVDESVRQITTEIFGSA